MSHIFVDRSFGQPDNRGDMELVGEDTNFGALAFTLIFLALILFVSFLSRRKQSIAQGTWLGTAGMKAKHIWNHAAHDQRNLMLAAADLPAGTASEFFLSAQWSDLPASIQMSLARTLEEIRNETQLPKTIAEETAAPNTAGHVPSLNKDTLYAEVASTVASQMDKLNALAQGDRKQFRQVLAGSVQLQDSLMMADIVKVLHKVPEGSSIVALRQYHGTVLAGLVVVQGDLVLTFEGFRKGALNPDSSPGMWRLIPESRLKLLAKFTDPPEAALAFLALAPSGGCRMAFSHIARADNNVQWVSSNEYIENVVKVLLEVGLFEEGSPQMPEQT